MSAASTNRSPNTRGDPPERTSGEPVAATWEWFVEEGRVVLSESFLRQRDLPSDQRETTYEAMLARVHPDDRAYIDQVFRRAAAERRSTSATFRVMDGSGRLRTVKTAADVFGAAPTRVVGASVDTVVFGDSATTPAGFVDAVLETLIDALVVCSRTGVPVIVNHAARSLYERATGNQWTEHEGRTWFERLLSTPPDDTQAAPWRHPADVAIAGGDLDNVEMQVRTPAGSPLVVLLSARAIRRGDDLTAVGVVVTLHDATAERRAQEQLARGLTHEWVTGLPNRRRFIEHLATEMAAPGSADLAVAVVELRGLSNVTERFGHDVGDATLRFVGQALQRFAVDPCEGYAASLGGERYAMCGSSRDVDALALRIPEVLQGALSAAGVPAGGGVSAHLGIAACRPSATAEAVLGEAEAAAGDAKQRGLRVVRDNDDTALAGALSAGIRAGELAVLYQPLFRSDSQAFVGAEALVRWNRGGRDLVAPAEFIGVAERTGLIAQVDEWVLHAALRDLSHWAARHGALHPFRLSVNISASQLEMALADLVAESLEAAHVAPTQLTIEITESAVVRDVAAAVRVIRRLRDLGVRVAIDDFGIGYSSLSYLRQLPADELKIDRSFVSELGGCGSTALVEGIVSIAHALQLETVAEGVETTEQLVALQTVGCDAVQGFLLSPPVDASSIGSLLTESAATSGVATTARTRDDAARARTVLVADDEEDLRRLARICLAMSGFEVFEANDGADALAKARELRPAVVMLDVHMPRLDGFAVCRALRADPLTRNAAIVMLTAAQTPADRLAAYSAGADDYVLKPFAPRDLVTRVRAADGRRSEAPPPTLAHSGRPPEGRRRRSD